MTFQRHTPIAGMLTVVACAMGPMNITSAPAQAQPVDGWTGSRLLAIADADMAATAYANGELHPIEGSADQIFLLNPAATEAPQRAPASNTVMGWPGSLAVSADGRYAYVVTSRAQVDRSIEKVDSVFEDVPIAGDLTTVNVETGSVVSVTKACDKAMSVDVAPSGGWLLVACGRADGEAAVIPLIDGLPSGAPRVFDLDVPTYADRAIDAGATYGVIHPGGRAAALVFNNRAVGLVRFDVDAAGAPVAAKAEDPTETARWLSVARWTRTGRHLIVTDVAWGPRPTDAVFNGRGEILSFALAPDDPARGIVAAAKVSKSPEAIELNRKGDLLVAVNMERTYLPGGLLSIFRGRSASSLSLVAVDDATGALRTLGEPLKFRGVLPEDAVFDADGDRLAVAVFQDHDAPKSGGWIEFFRIVGAGDARRIEAMDRKIMLPRGVHDLAPID
ncbi:MAG: hypothetical protein AAFX08_08260 [Pseudomonadota bacterium]